VRDPRPYLRQSDVFVLASRNDPSPLVIPEAREAACAIVATAVGGIPESLDNGRAGVLVAPENPRELASAIDRLLRDPDERALWRQRASEDLTWLHLDRAVAETMAIYRQVLSSAPSPRSRAATAP
jgi:glycosyltransferase involved in cell wall biosynthesis